MAKFVKIIGGPLDGGAAHVEGEPKRFMEFMVVPGLIARYELRDGVYRYVESVKAKEKQA
jgi:hypothetical protein